MVKNNVTSPHHQASTEIATRHYKYRCAVSGIAVFQYPSGGKQTSRYDTLPQLVDDAVKLNPRDARCVASFRQPE